MGGDTRRTYSRRSVLPTLAPLRTLSREGSRTVLPSRGTTPYQLRKKGRNYGLTTSSVLVSFVLLFLLVLLFVFIVLLFF